MPINIKHLRGNPEIYKENERKRFRNPELIDNLLRKDEQWRKNMFQLDNLRKEINTVQKKITDKIKAKKKGETENIDITEDKNELKTLKQQSATLTTETDTFQEIVQVELHQVSNLLHDSVPIHKNEEDSVTVSEWTGPNETLHRTEYSHHELLHMIGGYDPERGVKIAGHRAYFLTGVGVELNRAIMNYAIDYLTTKRYQLMQTPQFMRSDVMAKTAELADFNETLYKIPEPKKDVTQKGITNTDLYLIATSEQPISAYHMNETLDTDELPKHYCGISTCFRREAGSTGKDTWGIFRVHQFEKIEQFVMTQPEKSYEQLEQMIQVSQYFYQTLGLSYRIVNIASGDMNSTAAKKYDLEAWFPYQNTYRELVSCSNCTDYQSRALNIKILDKTAEKDDTNGKDGKDNNGDNVHMLNGTLCATTRTLCCLLENYWVEEKETDEEGNIKVTRAGIVVPKPLRSYMSSKYREFIPFVKPRPENLAKQRTARGLEKKQKKKK
jgi:seryl-tRNA synthetase